MRCLSDTAGAMRIACQLGKDMGNNFTNYWTG